MLERLERLICRRVYQPYINLFGFDRSFCCCGQPGLPRLARLLRLRLPRPESFPLSEVHRGLHGVAYTVFEGTQPEAMDVEILGVLKNVLGPDRI
jgi:hypothetical protein